MKVIKTNLMTCFRTGIFLKRSSRSMLERSEEQIRAASSLEELLRITHAEDWKLWQCRLKLKSLSGVDARSASHRSTRFAATFYDIETLKGRCMGAEASSVSVLSLSVSDKCTNF